MFRRFIALLLIIGLLIINLHCKEATAPVNETGLFVPADLEATLWAESPMIYNPTNMDVDSKGRIWITEAVNYRNFNNDSTKFFHRNSGDRVMILEDTDQDGKADTAIVFVEDVDLRSPVGIAVIGNKVIVSCSPNMIIYTDENGDDQPDKNSIMIIPCMQFMRVLMAIGILMLAMRDHISLQIKVVGHFVQEVYILVVRLIIIVMRAIKKVMMEKYG